MDELIAERIAQAEAQLVYWREQQAVAARQVAMWEGAAEALRGVKEAAATLGGETFGEDDVARLKAEEQG